MISINLVIWVLFGIFFFGFLFFPSYWLFRKIKSQSQKPIWKKIVHAVLFPFNFGALFLEQRKIDQLPVYYRWFLEFTEFSSRIQYFHFLPKALIAFLAEWIIMAITGEDLLTALIFFWSILFLIIITWVESKSGNEMNSDTVVFANKLFLYTVSMIGLFLVLLHSFFWESVETVFNTPFLRIVSKMAHGFNSFLLDSFYFFWDISFLAKSIILFILLIYIFSFRSFSGGNGKDE